MTPASFFICGIVRDVATRFPHNYNVLRAYFDARRCANVYWYFYENDSVDTTVEVLRHCQQHNDNFHFESEKLGAVSWPSRRINPRAKALCLCRNKYLQRLADMDYGFDYMLVVDMDLLTMNVSHISTAMSYDADMVGAYGCHVNSSQYYDGWALGGCDIGTVHKLNSSSPKQAVTSCFGGMGLYKVPSVRYLWYNKNPECAQYPHADHGTLHEEMRNVGHTKMYICPQWLTEWKPNAQFSSRTLHSNELCSTAKATQ